MTAKKGSGAPKRGNASKGRAEAPRQARGARRPGRVNERVDARATPLEAMNPELRRLVVRYVRDDMTAVFVANARPEGPTMKPRPLPATTVVFPKTKRVGLTEDVVRTWRDLQGTAKDPTRPPVEVTDGIRWMSNLLLFGTDALIDAAADLGECDDLSKRASNTLTAIGNAVSKAVRRSVLLGALQFYDWDMRQVSDSFRLGGTSHVLRAIKELGLEAEINRARESGLVKRGRPRKSANKK